LPLFPPLEPQAPYPMDALGPLAPGAKATAAQVQVAECVAGTSVLAVGSLVAQAVGDIQLPIGARGQAKPLSLFFATVALSGQRKSSADVVLLRPVRQHEAELRESYNTDVKAWRIDHRAWQAQMRALERNTRLDLKARKAALRDAGPEPEKPIRPAFLVPDLTIEGLARRWTELPAALGLFSAEGGQVTGGFGFSVDHKLATAASLSSLWDSGTLRRLRARDDDIVDLVSRRLAAHIMIQPKAAMSFLGDEVLRDQGLHSRLLLSAPASLAGNRLFKESDQEIERALLAYDQLILAAFEAWPKSLREVNPRLLSLSRDARKLWIEFYNTVETAQGSKGLLADLQEIANKAPEQAARIAGVLTIIAKPDATEVDGEMMSNGVKLAAWYLDEARRLASAVEASPDLLGAQAMLNWLHEAGKATVTVREAQQYGPHRLREKALIEAAFRVLREHGWLETKGDGRKVWWEVKPEPSP
jgi:hypothetical protein